MKTKKINFKRLEIILSSINTNVVKHIHITPKNCCSSGNIDWFDIEIFTTFNTSAIYSLWVADADPRYTEDGIVLFNKILKKYNDLPITYDRFEHYVGCIKESYNLDILTPRPPYQID